MERTKAPEKPSRLGRGLAALIPPPSSSPPQERTEGAQSPGVQTLALDAIAANPHQPRTVFQESAIADLADSVRRHGVLQPVMVRPRGGGRYELVAGERRYRAAREAGLTHIPAVVRSLTDEESLTVALIENIQREDLNPIEAARGYKQLMDQFGLTQTQLGEQIGKKQSTISNAMRLLNLPSDIQETISSGRITVEHGKVLLSVTDPEKQREVWERVLLLGHNVKDAQADADMANLTSPSRKKKKTTRKSSAQDDLHLNDFVDHFRALIGMKVAIKTRTNGSGIITIDFASMEDVEGLLERLKAT